MSKTVFVRSSGELDKKSRQELLEEKRKINYRCMELRLNAQSTKEAVAQARKEGITNRNGGKLTPMALMYRCQWALIDNPDLWRDRIDAYDRKTGQKPLTDDEWDEHVVEVGIDLAKHSAGHVFRLFLRDPQRWSRWMHKWEGNSDFASLNLPILVSQPQRQRTPVV